MLVDGFMLSESIIPSEIPSCYQALAWSVSLNYLLPHDFRTAQLPFDPWSHRKAAGLSTDAEQSISLQQRDALHDESCKRPGLSGFSGQDLEGQSANQPISM